MHYRSALHAKEVELLLRLAAGRAEKAALLAETAALRDESAALKAEEAQLRRELGLPDEVIH